LKNKLLKYWNFKIISIPLSSIILIKVLITWIYECFLSFFWRFNFGKCGSGLSVQKGTVIRYPKNINIGDNVNIGRNVNFSSEDNYSRLIIGNYCQINKNVNLDFTGNLYIADNVVISASTIIMSHDHGLDPKSKPQKILKKINENTWIGQNVIILPKVENIGKDSIIAAGSVVTKNVPDKVIVAGNPAKIIKHL